MSGMKLASGELSLTGTNVTYVIVAMAIALVALGFAAGLVKAVLGTGTGTSIKHLIREIEEVFGRSVPHVYAPPRPGDPPSLFAAECRRARSTRIWRINVAARAKKCFLPCKGACTPTRRRYASLMRAVGCNVESGELRRYRSAMRWRSL